MRRRPLPWRAIATVALLLVVAVGGYTAVRAIQVRRKSAAAIIAKPIVVMPFTNVGGDTAQDYLAEGVAAELANSLSRNPELRVAPRVTAAALRRQGKSAREVGAALRAAVVVEGSVWRGGGRIRLTADLLSVADGRQLWSNQVEGNAQDILALEDDVEQRVAVAVQTSLHVKPTPGQAAHGTRDATAFDLYLHGRYLLTKRGDASAHRAVTLFQEAIKRDSMFARAYGGVGVAQTFVVLVTPRPDPEQLNAIIASCERALELDPGDPDGHLTMGYLMVLRSANEPLSDAQAGQSEQHFKRALAKEPSRPLGHEWYAQLLGKLSRYEESLDQMKIAQALDPTSARVASEVADVLFNVRYQAALAENMQSSALDTVLSLGFRNYSGALAFLHRSDEMVKAFRQVLVLDPNYPNARGHMVYALAATSKHEEADKLAADLLRDADTQRTTAYEVAVSRMGLGDVDGALKWLRKSIEATELETGPRRLACDPYFDPLLIDVRFQVILQKIGARNCPRTGS